MDNNNREFRDLCTQMSNELMKPFLKQKEYIYIDADLLYNYRLGAVLALTRGEEQYNYVVANMQKYLDAPTLECAKFFPDLNLTDQQLDEFIVNPKYYNFINAASPASNFIDNLGMMIRVMNTLNQSRETTRPLRLTINQRLIKIHPVYRRGIVHRIHDIDPTVIVDFTNYKNWFEVPEKLIEAQDFICVYDLIDFLRQGTSSQKVLATMPPKLSQCCIVALKQAEVPNPTAEHFVNLKVMLEIVCDKFSYINKTIIQSEE